MQASRPFKSSRLSLPSPDGRLVATLHPTVLEIVSVETLQTVEVIAVPFDEGTYAQVCGFAWSPSSERVLVALPDQVHVFCAQDPDYHAAVRLGGASLGVKPALVRFGARDTELCVCVGLGLKLAVFDLATSTSVEIANPKLDLPLTAPRGLSFRPETGHMAVLTRCNGKDVVSIHHPTTREVEASWHADTHDAQSIDWTPDGRWLAVAESASQGRRLVLSTPDGSPFRTWPGAAGIGGIGGGGSGDDMDDMGAGIRHVHPRGRLLCICDHTRRITVLDSVVGSETMAFFHPTIIYPRDTLQVWTERLDMSTAPPLHIFSRATQPFGPPSRTLGGDEARSGCSSSELDTSTVLLVSKLDDSDNTLWIWDTQAAELRAALAFTSSVASFSWHPRIPELLMVTCSGDMYREVAFVWTPVSGGPQPIQFGPILGVGKMVGKPHVAWIDIGSDTPALQVGDWASFVLVALAGPNDVPAAWIDDDGTTNYRRSITTRANVDEGLDSDVEMS